MAIELPHDDKLVVVFKNHAVQNPSKSKEAGRPIFDDMEICEIRVPGSRNMSPHPATEISHKHSDMYGTEEIPVTYAERFSKQYRQFKAQEAQTISGTPLQHAPFLTEARRAELRALNIYTVEQLAVIDGIELKNIGHAGRDLKNAAIEYIESSKQNAPNIAMQEELEALRARNQILEEDNQLMKARAETDKKPDQFDDMSLDQLRDYIASATGHPPHGALNRKTLERMAREASKNEAA